MAANINPIFTLVPVASMGVISTANTNRDGTGTIATIATAGADGLRIAYVRVVAQGTTTAGMVRLFISDGTNTRLWYEMAVTAITPSGTLTSFSGEYMPTQPLVLPNGYSLRASTNNAETFNVFAHGGSFS